MEIAYITADDPESPFSWSGISYYMFRALKDQGLGVTHVGKSLRNGRSCLPRSFQRILNSLVPLSPLTDMIAAADRSAALLEKELRVKSYDAIFTPVSSREIALLNTNLPIVYLSDATPGLLANY